MSTVGADVATEGDDMDDVIGRCFSASPKMQPGDDLRLVTEITTLLKRMTLALTERA
jgi:hypothetical protein